MFLVNQLISLKNTAPFHMVSCRVSEKCVFLCNNNLVKKQPPECSAKNGVLKNFTNFTGKHVCWTCPATLLKSNSNTGVSV